jgi:hypothetical protein
MHTSGMRKFCKRCRMPKEPGAFGKNRRQPDGLTVWCRKCLAEKAADRRARGEKTSTGRPRMPRTTVSEKLCSRCNETRPASAFNSATYSPDGLQRWCKACRAERKRELRLLKAGGDTAGECVASGEMLTCDLCGLPKPAFAFRKQSPKISIIYPSWCLQCRSRYLRARTLQTNYGITVEQYDAMLGAQGGTCAICGGTNPNRPLAVDHDHVSGLVRGLLCNGCNILIGYIEKLDRSPDLETKCRAYLDQSQELEAA